MSNVELLGSGLVCHRISGETVNDVWEELYSILSSQGVEEDSRDGEVCGELISPVIVVRDPSRNVVTSPIRNMPIRYAVGELLWYLSGSNKVSDIRTFSKAWDNLTDDGETLNSAYGFRIFEKFGFDQWEHVKSLLKADPNTRQAVIHIKDASNEQTKDLPCTLTLQFLIRDGKLNLIANMRSNDIWLGFPYDAFSFTCLQIKMAMELGVELGLYIHMAGSMHLYKRNLVKEPEFDGIPCEEAPKRPVNRKRVAIGGGSLAKNE